MREASYRFRACFRDRWGGYLALVLLLGLVGGVAMAAVAGARRTQSSFPAYLASTNPGDLQAFTEFDPISGTGYSPKVDRAIARVRYVRRAADVIGFDGTLQPLGPVARAESLVRRRPRSRAALTASTSRRTGSAWCKAGWPIRLAATRWS